MMQSFEGAVESSRRVHDFKYEFICEQLDQTAEVGEARLARLFIPACWGYRADLEIGGPEAGGIGCIRVAHEGK
eukprot:2659441-Amphidinium_carterae.2